jgi:hypothetical protein
MGQAMAVPRVVLLLAGAVFIVYLLQLGREEMRQLWGEKQPRVVSVTEALSLQGARWVTLTGGEWHCEAAEVRYRRGFVARLLFGKVDSVEVPIVGARKGDLVVVRFAREASCSNDAPPSVTGVIGSREIFTSTGTRQRWSEAALRLDVINVDESPSSAMRLMALLIAVLILVLGYAGYSIRAAFL